MSARPQSEGQTTQECPIPLPPRRGPRQIDIVRAIRGAEAGGLRVTRIEIDGARVTLFTESASSPAARGPRNVSLRILGASSQAGNGGCISRPKELTTPVRDC